MNLEEYKTSVKYNSLEHLSVSLNKNFISSADLYSDDSSINLSKIIADKFGNETADSERSDIEYEIKELTTDAKWVLFRYIKDFCDSNEAELLDWEVVEDLSDLVMDMGIYEEEDSPNPETYMDLVLVEIKWS